MRCSVGRAGCLAAALAVLLSGCGSGTTRDPFSTGGSSSGSTGTTDNAPGTGIFGRLTDAQGQPVTGATCELVGPTGLVLGSPVTTDDDGSFHLTPPDGGVPDGSLVRVTPHGGPAHTAPVGAPGDGPSQLELQFGDDGSLGVHLALSLPDDAAALDQGEPGGRTLVRFTSGVSGPFSVRARDTFDLSMRDVALVWRQRGQAWRVQRLTTSDGSHPALRLDAAAAALHGDEIEVAALSAGRGQLAGLTTFTSASDLRFAVRLSAPTLHLIVVATRDVRIDGGGLLANAIVADGGRRGEVALSSADMAVLGLSDGARVRLGMDAKSTSATVRAASGAAFGLLTAQLGDDLLDSLGIDLDQGYAGRRLTLAATP